MMWHELFTRLQGAVVPVILFFLKILYERRKAAAERKKADPVAEAVKENMLVANKLESIKSTYSADRVWIMQFHNGGNFYPTGKSITKFSMCYESISSHADSIQDRFQNIPVSLFNRSINYLLDNDVILIPDYSKKTSDIQELKYISEETGARSSYAFAIKTIDDKFVGILGMDYEREKRDMNQGEINDLSIDVSAIGGILHNFLVKKV